jgi:hypothetical protein
VVPQLPVTAARPVLEPIPMGKGKGRTPDQPAWPYPWQVALSSDTVLPVIKCRNRLGSARSVATIQPDQDMMPATGHSLSS